MKIALLICGFFRSYNLTYNTIKSVFLDKYDVDIYIHLSDDEEHYDHYLNNKYSIEDIIKLYKPIGIIIENEEELHNKYSNNITKVIWHKINILNNFKNMHNKNYDLVIKLRPDIYIYDTIIDLNKMIDGKLYIPSGYDISSINKLANLNDPHINDHIAIGTSHVINVYCSLINNIDNYIILSNSNISETLLAYHIKNLDVVRFSLNYKLVLSMCNIIAITGNSGSGKSTLADILTNIIGNDVFKIEGDRYHKWERGDENWNKYTHLNPEANFLCKMNDDMFKLKIGDCVYQVDYDHANGKFKSPEKINPHKNIIMCGLHSLYNNFTLYSLKIYIDTCPELLKFWKIRRDVIERGYDIDSVINNINKRYNDNKKYIEPQQNNADLIIKYSSNDNINYCDFNININVVLSVKITRKYNINRFIHILNEQKINFTLNFDNNYNIFIFNDSNISNHTIYSCINSINNTKMDYDKVASNNDGLIQFIVIYLLYC